MEGQNENHNHANIVTFMSYNPTGINSLKAKWIVEICEENNVDYLSVQEHFKSARNTDKFFSDNFSSFDSYIVQGHRSKGNETGRYKGGLAQLSNKIIGVRKDLGKTKSWRL